MHRIALATSLLLGLAACGGSVPPVTFATPDEIAALYKAEAAPDMPPPPAYAATCYDRNLRAGTNYFNGLVTKQNQAGKLGMLGGAAVAAASAAGGPIGLVGGLGAATALGSGLLSAEASPGGELPVTAYSLWQRQNAAYLLAAPTPQDQPTAQLLCDANAVLATPIGIQSAEMSAMMSAPVMAMPMMPGAAPVVVGPPGEATLTPPGTPLPHHHRRSIKELRALPTTDITAEQFQAIQQYGRNAVEGGQRVLPPMICVGCVK